MFDTKALAEAMAPVVREHVDAVLAPVLARLEALETAPLAVPEKGDPGPPGKDGADGRDVDPEALKAMIDATVAAITPSIVDTVIASLPAPEKGDPGEPGPEGKPGEDGKPGTPGKDGVGLAGMMINRDGEAIATLTDGTMVNLGPVVGRDGNDGAPGEPGRDGRDGLDVDDITVTQEGSTVEFGFQVGDVRSIFEVELPTGPAGADGQDAYAGAALGLHDPAKTYRAMDAVSFNGSEWRARHDDPGEIPGPGWMLSASKGKRGDRGEPGAPGADGLSPVAVYLRGHELVITLSDGAELTADLSELKEGAE